MSCAGIRPAAAGLLQQHHSCSPQQTANCCSSQHVPSLLVCSQYTPTSGSVIYSRCHGNNNPGVLEKCYNGARPPLERPQEKGSVMLVVFLEGHSQQQQAGGISHRHRKNLRDLLKGWMKDRTEEWLQPTSYRAIARICMWRRRELFPQSLQQTDGAAACVRACTSVLVRWPSILHGCLL